MKTNCKVCGRQHDGHPRDWCSKCLTSWNRFDKDGLATISEAAEWGARRRFDAHTMKNFYAGRRKEKS